MIYLFAFYDDQHHLAVLWWWCWWWRWVEGQITQINSNWVFRTIDFHLIQITCQKESIFGESDYNCVPKQPRAAPISEVIAWGKKTVNVVQNTQLQLLFSDLPLGRLRPVLVLVLVLIMRCDGNIILLN